LTQKREEVTLPVQAFASSPRETAMDTTSPPTTIDQYLAAVEPRARALLQHISELIHECAPGAAESISYGLPTLTLDGPLLYFGAATNHCTIRFTVDKPLPDEVIRRIVGMRLVEKARRSDAKGANSKSKVKRTAAT
jgi:uncharacterized protein YdhG (YjbR/CyaY superfamily)